MGYPGWQFLAFLCLGEKLPRWTYLARKCWIFSSSARLTWVEFCEWKFLSFPLCLVASYLGGVSWVEVPCSAPAPSWNSLFDSFLEFKGFAGLPLSAEKFPRWSF